MTVMGSIIPLCGVPILPSVVACFNRHYTVLRGNLLGFMKQEEKSLCNSVVLFKSEVFVLTNTFKNVIHPFTFSWVNIDYK